MKQFIDRVREAFDSEYAWAREPLFFKTFVAVFAVVLFILKVIYCFIVAVTIPLWVVPYIIYYTRRSRK